MCKNKLRSSSSTLTFHCTEWSHWSLRYALLAYNTKTDRLIASLQQKLSTMIFMNILCSEQTPMLSHCYTSPAVALQASMALDTRHTHTSPFNNQRPSRSILSFPLRRDVKILRRQKINSRTYVSIDYAVF